MAGCCHHQRAKPRLRANNYGQQKESHGRQPAEDATIQYDVGLHDYTRGSGCAVLLRRRQCLDGRAFGKPGSHIHQVQDLCAEGLCQECSYKQGQGHSAHVRKAREDTRRVRTVGPAGRTRPLRECNIWISRCSRHLYVSSTAGRQDSRLQL